MHNSLCLGLTVCVHISPKYQVIYANSDLKLTCNNIKGKPKWFREDQSSIRGAIYELNYLKISKVNEEDSGIYVCEGDDMFFKSARATSVVLVGCKFNDFSKLILLSVMEEQFPIKNIYIYSV